MIISIDDYLAHYGMPRRSGRYPWGSGENPYQRSKSFMGIVDDLRKQGMKDTDIAKGFGITTTELRQMRTIARNTVRRADIAQAQRLRDRGWSHAAIAERMGYPNESSVRSLLAPNRQDALDILEATSEMLKRQVDEKKYVDVGVGVEHRLPGAPDADQLIGISRTKLDTALAKLKDEGYEVHPVKIDQLGTGHQTELKVLAPPGTPQKEVWMNRHEIRQITEHSDDGGRTFVGEKPVVSLDSKRIAVNYAEDGGADADGTIYIRPGVPDISLGSSRYAQVRIGVDGTHFLKGMAIYKSDLPDGVDLVFNTNKSKTEVSSDLDAMKPMKTTKEGSIDKDNPFGAQITRQSESGVMHIVREEGAWAKFTRSLSSQFLSKQSLKLVREQLSLKFEQKQNDLETAMEITNPAVRRKLLTTLADEIDASAVHLEAAALPRQGSHVLLPVPSMKSTEVYAPKFRNGETVVLVRHPHGGTFELPELKVNNRHPEAKKLLGNAKDAIGINPHVAAKLSGADFDGDDVIVIPNNQGKVKVSDTLAGLRDFDPIRDYKDDSLPPMSNRTKQQQMGSVSNLITDMTIRGASASELARAVRHSMVVIDAEKHNLDYKRSAQDNGIRQLKEKYQGKHPSGQLRGASTLVSRAESEIRVPERKQGFKIDPSTGEKIFTPTGRTFVNKRGKEVPKTQSSTRLAETKDAHTLSSGTPVEKIYADHSNRLKKLANETRKEVLRTKNIPYSPSAKQAYADEVASLNSKLTIAKQNAPRERQAQIVGNAILAKKRQDDPNMTPEEVKKVKAQALAEARTRTGAGKTLVKITKNEWDAIQAGAISNNKLEEILNNSDLEEVKKLATPRAQPTMTSAKIARANSMAALGYTQSEIADALGVSVSTISDVIS